MKIKTKLTINAVTLALVPLVTTAIILGWLAVDRSTVTIEETAKNQLIAVRDTKKIQIEDYFATIRNQVLTFANDKMIIDAVRKMKDAFNQVPFGLDREQEMSKLKPYYANEFDRVYKDSNSGKSAGTNTLLNQLDTKAIYWQLQYIQNNEHPLGSKHELDRAPEDNTYNRLHGDFHPHIRDYLDKFGYYDIFLVEPENGVVVYSVFKELDYATSLVSGPYANSGIADAYKAALKLKKGEAALVDFKTYKPSYSGQASFIASPIYDGGTLEGVLIFQMPIDGINHIMTSDHKWKEIGQGDSGETYLVGHDAMARSLSRFLVEDKGSYLDILREIGTSDRVVAEIDSRDSNIGLQTISTVGTNAAINGNTGFDIFPDYRQVEVLSAYTPLNIQGLDWVLMSEIDKEEAFLPAVTLQNQIIWSATILLAVISAIAGLAGLFISRSLTQPIINLSEVLKRVDSEQDLTIRSPVTSNDEIGAMSTALNSMLGKFDEVIRQVNNSTLQVTTASNQLSQTSTENAKSVEVQRLETEQIAAAMNEMSMTVQEVAMSTTSAAEAATTSNEFAQQGYHRVSETTQAIQSLSENIRQASEVIERLSQESSDISSVVDVINDIADQTNLLALNAAIEAARAGEQGRGFAVVADEVRTLAQRTQQSTHEIESMITKLQQGATEAVQAIELSQGNVEKGVTLATETNAALDSILQSVASINDLNTQVASAAEEQSSTTEEMNKNIVNIGEIAAQTSASTEEIAAAATELANLSTGLQQQVSQFKVD